MWQHCDQQKGRLSDAPIILLFHVFPRGQLVRLIEFGPDAHLGGFRLRANFDLQGQIIIHAGDDLAAGLGDFVEREHRLGFRPLGDREIRRGFHARVINRNIAKTPGTAASSGTKDQQITAKVQSNRRAGERIANSLKKQNWADKQNASSPRGI